MPRGRTDDIDRRFSATSQQDGQSEHRDRELHRTHTRDPSILANHIQRMNLDLTDDEAAALGRLLRQAIDEDRYPLPPRLAPLRAILEKLEPPKSRPELPPPLRAYDAPQRTAPTPRIKRGREAPGGAVCKSLKNHA
jgi:hypothetical protein